MIIKKITGRKEETHTLEGIIIKIKK